MSLNACIAEAASPERSSQLYFSNTHECAPTLRTSIHDSQLIPNMTVPKMSQLRPGVGVNVVLKADQRSGRLTSGSISEVHRSSTSQSRLQMSHKSKKLLISFRTTRPLACLPY